MIYLIDFCGFPWCILPWLLSGLLGFLMGYFWMKKWQTMYDDMESKYNGLKRKYADLEGDLEACRSARATVEGDLATAKGRTREMQAELDKTKADFDTWKKNNTKSSDANLSGMASGFAAGAATTKLAEEKAPAKEEKSASTAKSGGIYGGLKADNLQIIEGIGPKMESVLHDAGVKNWSDLAGKSHDELRAILDQHGDKYKIINPSTWAEQAALAANGDFDKLIALQKDIDGAAGTKSAGGSDSKLEKIIGKTQKAGFSKFKTDDLKIVEGIGPKIAGLLVDAGINTWSKLSETPVSKIQEVLDAAGPRYKLAKPGTWPQQAGLAAAGKWNELRKLQDELDGGK